MLLVQREPKLGDRRKCSLEWRAGTAVCVVLSESFFWTVSQPVSFLPEQELATFNR